MITVSTKMGKNGRIVIPVEMRREFDMAEGESIRLTANENGVLVSTPRVALRRLQERYKKLVPEGVSLVDELIADRRKEAENE